MRNIADELYYYKYQHKLRSDKDTHFTGAISQNNSENENISIQANRITINSVILIADQNLNFDLAFFSKDTFQNTDLDEDTYLGTINMDLATNGKQINSGTYTQYYMSKEGVDFKYIDEDETKELHVALTNRSSTSKNAGATGEVVLIILYTVDEV